MPQWVASVWDWMNSPIGSGVTATAIVAIIVGSWKWFRQRVLAAFTQAWGFLSTVRVTTTKEIAARIDAAVAVATRKSAQEEAELERKLSKETQRRLRPWKVTPFHGEKYAYHLKNESAGKAEEIEVTFPYGDGFEFLSDAAWDEIPEGEFRAFHGRILRDPLSDAFGVTLTVDWVDAHGDARTYDIAIE